MAQDDTSGLKSAPADESLMHLSRLSAWIAHEINNSIGGIHTSFALLQRLIPVDHPHYRYVAAIEREIARSSALTQRVQQSYEYLPGNASAVPLPAALSEVRRSLTLLCQSRDVTLAIATPAGSGNEPTCSGVARAAIRHLLQHAVEGAEAGQVVEVQCRYDSDRLDVTVPNWDSEASHGVKWPMAGPRGLALSLAQQCARAVGGEVVVASRNGQGGMVCLTLPAHVSAGELECRTKE